MRIAEQKDADIDAIFICFQKCFFIKPNTVKFEIINPICVDIHSPQTSVVVSQIKLPGKEIFMHTQSATEGHSHGRSIPVDLAEPHRPYRQV